MKRITRSLLSLCLAFVLCAALLPMNVAKADDGSKTGEGTSVPQTKEPTFLITGYEASRSSIETGDTVSITVYLSRTDGRSDSIRVVRGLDSFQGGTADVIKKGSNGSYEVTFDNLTYTGDTNKTLNFTITMTAQRTRQENLSSMVAISPTTAFRPSVSACPTPSRSRSPSRRRKRFPSRAPSSTPTARARLLPRVRRRPSLFTSRTPARPPCATLS